MAFSFHRSFLDRISLIQNGPFLRGPTKSGLLDLRGAIFVFAGGIAETFDELGASLKKAGTKEMFDRADSAIDEYRQMKVPDFKSRLSAVLDVRDINEQSLANGKIGIPYIKRALIFRGLLENQGALLDHNDNALLSTGVVDAFLKVTKYKYGARSLGAVLNMCNQWRRFIDRSSLPSATMLAMHVESRDKPEEGGEEFLSIADGVSSSQ